MKYILRFVSIFIIVFITTSCTNILNISQENINVINKEDIEIKRIERSIYGDSGKLITKVYYEQLVTLKDTKVARIINDFFEEEENTIYNNQLKNNNSISIKNVIYNDYSNFLESVFKFNESLGEDTLSETPFRYSVDTESVLCDNNYLSILQKFACVNIGPRSIYMFGITFDINTGEILTVDRIVDTDADRFRDVIIDFVNNTDILSPEYKREEAYIFYKKNAEHNYKANSEEDMCVEKKKDVYELGYLTLDLDVSY